MKGDAGREETRRGSLLQKGSPAPPRKILKKMVECAAGKRT